MRLEARRTTTLATLAMLGLLALGAPPVAAVPPLKGPPVKVAYIERHVDHPPPLNNEPPYPTDEGLAGAELGLSDSNATGRFVGVAVALSKTIVAPDADIKAALATVLAKDKPRFVVVDAPADDLLALADMPQAKGVLFFNAGAPDDRLRSADCRANIRHVDASRTMLTDALLQFLVYKRWTRVLLVAGPHPQDKAYADALRASIRKFGGKLVADHTFDAHGGDLRDTAMTEFIQATRGPEYDVVAVADEADEFGTQLVYNTDRPRPVVGTAGLTPAAWGRPVEAWAAVQLQNRFRKLAGRTMRPIDYAAWMAVHAVGEAAVQLKSADPDAIRDLVASPAFEVGGFKGRALSFRAWDGQLREPIFDLWTGAVVAVAPIEGFLHEGTDLDTIGIDKTETSCKAMKG